MEYLKNVVVIKDKLANLLFNYTEEFKYNGSGFEEFSDEAIMYALLEYSKFPRHHAKQDRIIYLHGKCLEFEGKPHVYITVEFDEQYDCFMVLYPQNHKHLPF